MGCVITMRKSRRGKSLLLHEDSIKYIVLIVSAIHANKLYPYLLVQL